jgi:hypothetical protein
MPLPPPHVRSSPSETSALSILQLTPSFFSFQMHPIASLAKATLQLPLLASTPPLFPLSPKGQQTIKSIPKTRNARAVLEACCAGEHRPPLALAALAEFRAAKQVAAALQPSLECADCGGQGNLQSARSLFAEVSCGVFCDV